jgi:hypothetical protein
VTGPHVELNVRKEGMSSSVVRRIAAAGAAAAALAVAAPAVAAADSILYLRGGDVWLSSSDGAQSFQVTATGGWEYASQSDDGSVIVASRTRQLFVLNRNGDVVRELPTVIGSIWWNGPYEPQVSPDGAHVAYQYFTTTTGSLATGVAYADTDGSTKTHELHTGWGYPAWIDDATLLHSDPPNPFSRDTIVRRLDEPNNSGQQWFSDGATTPVKDGDLRGNRMVFVGGRDGELMPVYAFDGAPGEHAPDYCYHWRGPTGRFESPSFSPDGSALAWGEGDGIHVAALASGCEQPSSAGDLVIPGGRYPDWSGAAVPAPRARGPQDDPRTNPRTTPRDRSEPRARSSARLAAVKAKLAVALKQGLTVRVRNAGTGSVKLTATVSAATARKAKLGKRATKVASGSAKARGGSATVRLRFTKTAVKRLRRLPTVSLTIAGAGARTTATVKR